MRATVPAWQCGGVWRHVGAPVNRDSELRTDAQCERCGGTRFVCLAPDPRYNIHAPTVACVGCCAPYDVRNVPWVFVQLPDSGHVH